MSKAPIRPWDKDSLVLGIHLFGSGAGWCAQLHRGTDDPSRRGEVQLSKPSPESPRLALTTAERRTIREDCGLSLRECAAWHGVPERTLSYWENQDGQEPRGDADMALVALQSRLRHAAREAVLAIQQLREARPETAEGGTPVALTRYTPADYPQSQPAAEGLPHGAHNRLLALTAEGLAVAGIPTRIDYRMAGEMTPR